MQPNQEFAQAYWNRHRDHVLKLAVLFEMSESGTHQVSTRAMDRAIRYAKKVEDGLFKLLPMGFDNRGYVLAQMCEVVFSAGVEGLAVSEFTKRFKNMDPSFRKNCLDTLKETNDFYVLKRETGGRPANILVHKDFAEEAKERHPNLA